MVENWHLITVLNMNYKIIAKDIALKLWSLLPLIICPKHTSFVMRRYILDNVNVVWEGMEWAHSYNQDALFSKIDFEKAYDQIEWNFIIDMLEALGFGPIFLQYVVITMNGT